MDNMLDFPRPLHQLHIFKKGGRLYAVDLDKASLIEISAVIVDILKLSETRTTDAITEILKPAYSDEDIEEAFETLTGYAKQGLLFTRCAKSPVLFPKKDKKASPRLLLVLPGFNPEIFSDMENTNFYQSLCSLALTEF
ncbi:hypothetical protein F4X88_02605 [Candidatus Poribacteria bacterium]|nr:hypothetical protein [Candidatus Poribacteria bacterium]MYA55163.1 hypothetical protein [Candidatus Poribacteria bacterium]